MSHRLRLAGVVALVVQIAALIAVHFGVAEDLVDDLAGPVEALLLTLLAISGVGAAIDASLVERRRRDPSLPALPDDVIDPASLPPPSPIPREMRTDNDDDPDDVDTLNLRRTR